MRVLPVSTSLLIASLSWFALAAQAQVFPEPQVSPEQVTGEAIADPVVITPELVQAELAWQRAQLRWQQYRFVELPRQRQLLDAQVRLGESEISLLRRRLRDYRPFLQVGRYSPVRTAAENDALALQATEQRLELLKHERINLMRYSRQRAQLYQLEVLRTAARVRAVLAQPQAAAAP